MKKLYVTEAVKRVRKNMEEVGLNTSDMYFDEDNADLDSIIGETIPDAINSINASVASALLEGVVLNAEKENTGQGVSSYISDFKTLSVTGHTVEFSFEDSCMRIVALKAFDTDVIVTGEIAEGTAIGRQQLNPFTRGTFDAPVLIHQQFGKDGNPTFRYYSLFEDNSDFSLTSWLAQHGQQGREPFPLEHVEYMPFCELERGTLYHCGNAPYYDVSDRVKEMIIYQLTGMVLAIYGENEKAKYFFSLTGLSSSSNE